MFLRHNHGGYAVKLETKDVFPENLRVFDVHTWGGERHFYGEVVGNNLVIERIKKLLIHGL